MVIVAVISFLIKTAYNREKKRPATKSSLKKNNQKKNITTTVLSKGKSLSIRMDGWMDGQNRHFHLSDWYHLHKVKSKKNTDKSGENN